MTQHGKSLVEKISEELVRIKQELPTSKSRSAEERLTLLLDIVHCNDFPPESKRELIEQMDDLPMILDAARWSGTAIWVRETLDTLRRTSFPSEAVVHGA